MPSEQALHDKYGGGTEGFCRAVIDGMASDLSANERADYLVYLGAIAYLCEPSLAFEDSGVAYFVAARKLVPDHITACCYIIMMYREEPNGHMDLMLARECFQLVKQRESMLTKEEQNVFEGAMFWTQHHGASVAELGG